MSTLKEFTKFLSDLLTLDTSVNPKVRTVEDQSGLHRISQCTVLVTQYRRFDRSFHVECRRTLNIYEFQIRY